MRLLSYVICMILVIFGISFSVLNSVEVPLNYFIGHKTIYFPLLFLIILMMGVLLGIIAMLPLIIRLKMRAKHKKLSV